MTTHWNTRIDISHVSWDVDPVSFDDEYWGVLWDEFCGQKGVYTATPIL